VLQTDGSTSLTEVGNVFYLDDVTTGTGPSLKIPSGADFTAGEYGSWTPIGAIQTATGYEVAWHVPGTDQYSVWTTDNNGTQIGDSGLLSGTSAVLESAETSFQQDLNGDGVIGANATVSAGSTVELDGPSNVSVLFAGATGTLVLDQSTTFSGQLSNFTGNGNLSGSDQLDLKDIAFALGVSESYAGNSTGGVLTISDGQNDTANISLVGNYVGSTFSLSSDGHGGTIVIDPVAPDLTNGMLSFGEANLGDTYSFEVSPENQASAYLGNFTVDAGSTVNGQEAVEWHFNIDPSAINQEITQSYNVSLVDNQPQGTSQTTSQTVSVTIGGPGNDSFVFHPGIGTDIVANPQNSDTFELSGFSAITNMSQLSTLLHEAQTGISQSVFVSTNDGQDTTINLGNHDSITLSHVQLANLHASNFIIS